MELVGILIIPNKIKVIEIEVELLIKAAVWPDVVLQRRIIELCRCKLSYKKQNEQQGRSFHGRLIRTSVYSGNLCTTLQQT
jgi:hypothetical protein